MSTSGMVSVAGVPIGYDAAGQLALRLRDAGFERAADHLERVIELGGDMATLTAAERESALRVLEDCPPELAELRATLLAEHTWRIDNR